MNSPTSHLSVDYCFLFAPKLAQRGDLVVVKRIGLGKMRPEIVTSFMVFLNDTGDGILLQGVITHILTTRSGRAPHDWLPLDDQRAFNALREKDRSVTRAIASSNYISPADADGFWKSP